MCNALLAAQAIGMGSFGVQRLPPFGHQAGPLCSRIWRGTAYTFPWQDKNMRVTWCGMVVHSPQQRALCTH